ncbi:DUF1178 family protein [Tepidamorphus sp. 3E244]|uniref:DUF1178 family protein n=1 Tax=Tepidamorphus sp. 3E244 TaxID=3385498 RepID=UPI0038FC4BB0
MIRYSLRCTKGHEFEGWFSGSASFDEQLERGLVQCSTCGTSDVEKSLMAPSVKRTDAERRGKQPVSAQTQKAGNSPDQASTMAAAVQQLPDEAKAVLRKVRKAVMDNSDYVGPQFPEEARKIHYGEAPKRGIYGEASGEDTKALAEEGIEVFPLPELPEDKN